MALPTLLEALETHHKNYQLSMKARVEKMKRDRELIAQTYCFIQAIGARGRVFEPDNNVVYTLAQPMFTVDIENEASFGWRTDLLLTVGELEDLGATEPADQDARKRLVWHKWRPKKEEYKHIIIRYRERLPKDAKCKLVRQKSSYLGLSCEVE